MSLGAAAAIRQSAELTLGAPQGSKDRIRGGRREQAEALSGWYEGALATAHGPPGRPAKRTSHYKAHVQDITHETPRQWSDFRKNFQLLIVTMAAIVPDFDSGIGEFPTDRNHDVRSER